QRLPTSRLLSVAQTNGSHRVTNLDLMLCSLPSLGCFPELRMEPSQNFRRFNTPPPTSPPNRNLCSSLSEPPDTNSALEPQRGVTVPSALEELLEGVVVRTHMPAANTNGARAARVK
ncbi:hypothetical protein L9F63_008084, partial [Diploptera punctata]